MRYTAKERADFIRNWLAVRRGHDWSTDLPMRCTCCGTAYRPAIGTPTKPYKGAWKGVCRKRRKPNRWRLHVNRAWAAKAYRSPKPRINDEWILNQLDEIRRSVHARAAEFEDTRFWKYDRLARRYRRLLRLWWANPTYRAPSKGDSGAREGWITAGRNRLIARAKREGRQLQVGACTYLFKPDATDPRSGLPLFEGE